MKTKASMLAAVCVLALAPGMACAAQRVTSYPGAVTAQGLPNLEGTWMNTTTTRWERAAEYGDRLVMTPEEAAKIEGVIAKSNELANKPTDPNATVETLPNDCSGGRSWCNYNAQWTDPGSTVMRVNGQPRTSIITSPANGRIPWKAGKQPQRVIAEGGPRGPGSEGKFDNAEERSLPERCIVSQNFRDGALLTPTLYNNNIQIQQSKDAVAILVEMSHDVRLIKMNAPHGDHRIKRWFGDSVGHYEGDTLVVETIDFNPEQLGRSSDRLKLTERFTRVGQNRLLYRFTVEDPEVYSQPWSGEYEFTTSNGPLYEYACHEGNYGLEGLLAGARHAEQEAAAKQASTASK